MRIVAIAACLLGFFLVAGSQAQAAGPKLVQLSYEHSRDGSSKHFNLSAYAHNADSVRFTVRRHHAPISAPGRYNDHVTDTDLHPEDARHPWEVDRKHGGKAVLKAVRSSLKRKGAAIVRVMARNGGARDKAKVRIDVADCAMDPPLYPLSCEIGL
jgi:hypothetical protein